MRFARRFSFGRAKPTDNVGPPNSTPPARHNSADSLSRAQSRSNQGEPVRGVRANNSFGRSGQQQADPVRGVRAHNSFGRSNLTDPVRGVRAHNSFGTSGFSVVRRRTQQRRASASHAPTSRERYPAEDLSNSLQVSSEHRRGFVPKRYGSADQRPSRPSRRFSLTKTDGADGSNNATVTTTQTRPQQEYKEVKDILDEFDKIMDYHPPAAQNFQSSEKERP